MLNKILLFIAFENEENKCDRRASTKRFAFKYTTRQYLFLAQNSTIRLSSLYNVFDSNVRSGGRTKCDAKRRYNSRFRSQQLTPRRSSDKTDVLGRRFSICLVSRLVRLHLTSSHNNSNLSLKILI